MTTQQKKFHALISCVKKTKASFPFTLYLSFKNMKKYAKVTLLAAAALLGSSCEYYGGYSTFSYSTGNATISTTVAWTAASYDVNGFPIYGYAYGRPVYGYTYTGRPIYVVTELYAGCYVPDWRPAPWCTHHYHYPSGCHHAPKPPKYHHGHNPGLRPKHEPHKGPQQHHVDKPHHNSGKQHHSAPKPNQPVSRPSTIKRPDKPQANKPVSRPSTVKRPDKQQANKPVSRPSTVKRPANQQANKPVSRPSTVKRPANQQANKPVSRPSPARRKR